MRFEYPKRFFRNAGKSFFNRGSKPTTIDDSVTEKEKNELLGNTENSISELNNNTEVLYDLAKEFSIELTDLKSSLEKAQESPNSKEWVELALRSLANSVNIACKYNNHSLKDILIEIARILSSADRVGKAGLIIDKLYILHAELCLLAGEWLVKKSDKNLYEKLKSVCKNIAYEVEKMGIKLISDEESLMDHISAEIIPIDTKEDHPTQSSVAWKKETDNQHYSLPEIIEPFNATPFSEETRTKPIEEIFQSSSTEIPALSTPRDNTAEISLDPFQTSSVENPPESVTKDSGECIPVTSQPNSDVNNFESSSIPEEHPTHTSASSNESSTHQSYTSDYSKYLSTILSNIKNENLKQKLEATLTALAENSTELAKQKALELAIEIANLEILEIKNQQKSIELQIKTTMDEINHVETNIDKYKYEEEQIKNELYTQEKLREEKLKEKQNAELELSKIREELQDIENQINLLLKKKEDTIIKIQKAQESIETIDEAIEENQKFIQSVKDSLSEVDIKLNSLNEKKSILLSILEEKQNSLKILTDQLTKKENSLSKLMSSLELLVNLKDQTENQIPSHSSNLDLFSGDSL